MITTTTNAYKSKPPELQSTLRLKGQITLPPDVRNVLGISEGDGVVFTITDKKLR